jgi:hypothetical protein
MLPGEKHCKLHHRLALAHQSIGDHAAAEDQLSKANRHTLSPGKCDVARLLGKA